MTDWWIDGWKCSWIPNTSQPQASTPWHLSSHHWLQVQSITNTSPCLLKVYLRVSSAKNTAQCCCAFLRDVYIIGKTYWCESVILLDMKRITYWDERSIYLSCTSAKKTFWPLKKWGDFLSQDWICSRCYAQTPWCQVRKFRSGQKWFNSWIYDALFVKIGEI